MSDLLDFLFSDEPDAPTRAAIDELRGQLGEIDDRLGRLADLRADLLQQRRAARKRIKRLQRSLGLVELPPLREAA